MMEPFSQSMELQGFRYDFDTVDFSLNFYKTRMKKLINTNAEKNSIQFRFQFHLQSKYKYNVLLQNGQLITAHENNPPIRTSKIFLADPHLFKHGWEFPGFVIKMLTKVGIDRVGATESTIKDFKERIDKKAFQIVERGGLMLSLGIHITCKVVYKRNQTMDELLQEQIRYQQQLLDEHTTAHIMRRSAIEASERLKMIPASRKAIDELEKIKFDGEGRTSVLNKVCSICLDEFEIGLDVTRLPCFHGFHGDCITKWLETSHFCPSCRFKMPINGDSL